MPFEGRKRALELLDMHWAGELEEISGPLVQLRSAGVETAVAVREVTHPRSE